MLVKQQAIATKSGFLKNFIANPKERKIFSLSLIVTVCLILAGIFSIFLFRPQLMAEDIRHYKGTFKQIGSISRIGFFAVVSMYPVFLILKLKKLKQLKWHRFELKPLLQIIGKLLRKWHAPIALISTGLVILHAYMALMRGFKIDFTYITGLISILVLLILLYMGLKRYKRNDNKWHLKLAISFLVLFMIHATFS